LQLYEIGQEIKRLRKVEGLTQYELSKLAGISRVTLGKLERGEIASISIKTLDIILNSLSLEIEFKTKDSNSFGLPSLDTLM